VKNLFRLARVLLKGSSVNAVGSGKRKRNVIGNAILMTVLGVYFIGIMVASALGLFEILSSVGLQSIMVGLYLSLGTVLVFLFGILYVISIFYYTGDVEKLLPLPLKAQEIIGAKLIVTAVWEYLYLAVLILPPLIVYGILSGADFLYFLLLVLVFIFLPVVPLCMASIIVMLIMRFTPLARNKDRFNLISGILAMVLALAFVFGMQSLSSFSEMDLTRIIESGADAVAQITSVIFPGTSFAVGSLTAIQALERLGQVAMLLLVAVIAVVVTLQAARFLYFAGVVDVNTSVSKRKKLSRDELQTAGKSGSAFWSYCLKDIRILIRTPIFFMNNVMMNFLWPVFLVIPFLTGAADEGLDQLIALARQLLSDPSSSAAPIAIAAFFAITCFIAGSNGITESALSREGKVFYILKTLPMSWRRQILAKITVGVIFSLLGILIPLAILLIVIRPPLWLALSLLAVVPGGVLLPNFSGIIFELFWPKLNWDNEQKAVKQNMNVLYGMGASLLFAALVLVPVFAFKLSVTTTVIAAAAGSLFLSLLVYRIIVRILPVRMALIEP